MDIEQLKYPIGRCIRTKNPSKELIGEWIATLERFPMNVAELIENAPPHALDHRYRPDGWAVKQVVHHCADSHMNSLIRFKLALTEEHPTIRPYHEGRWALLEDSLTSDLSDSLTLLTALHQKWTSLLNSLTAEQLQRTFQHPDEEGPTSLTDNIGIYAWHCAHHLAHIKIGLESGGRYDSAKSE